MVDKNNKDNIARILPHSLEAEEAVLGSMLINKNSIPSKLVLHTQAKTKDTNIKMLGINPGASYGSAKRWYPDKFAKVARELSRYYDIVILGGNDEKEIFKKCNIWDGDFPDKNTMEDGWLGTSPVDYYNPNNYGAYDTAGNVWEWCKDWFSASFHQNERKETRINPSGPKYGSSKTMKGGSYLCHNSYCNRYRASARTQNTTDSSTGNLGFRLIYRNK